MSGSRFFEILEIFTKTYFYCSCRVLIFTLSCYCTIFILYPGHLSEVGNYYYTCLINRERRVRSTDVYLLKLTLFWCPDLPSHWHKDLKGFCKKTALDSSDYLKPWFTFHINKISTFNTWIESVFQGIWIMQKTEIKLLQGNERALLNYANSPWEAQMCECMHICMCTYTKNTNASLKDVIKINPL